jgi:hypothetical protein
MVVVDLLDDQAAIERFPGQHALTRALKGRFQRGYAR